jgi:hypothetical protein
MRRAEIAEARRLFPGDESHIAGAEALVADGHQQRHVHDRKVHSWLTAAGRERDWMSVTSPWSGVGKYAMATDPS